MPSIRGIRPSPSTCSTHRCWMTLSQQNGKLDRVLEVCDELWLCGGRVSSGMAREIEEAQRLGIPIRQIGELEIKQEALPAEMEQSEAPGQSMGMA